MITPDEFPYIKSLYVNDCYAYRDFNIELHDYKPFSHLILTGKNGSGKSTILRIINNHITIQRNGEVAYTYINYHRNNLKNYIDQFGSEHQVSKQESTSLFQYNGS